MRYKDIRISHKLAISFALLIAMFAGVSAMVLSNVAEMDDASRTADNTFHMSMTAQDVQSSTVEQVNAVRGFTFSAKPSFLETYAKSREALRTSAEKFQANTQVEEQKHRMDAYVGLAKDLEGRLNRIVELARNPGTRAQA